MRNSYYSEPDNIPEWERRRLALIEKERREGEPDHTAALPVVKALRAHFRLLGCEIGGSVGLICKEK